ncbi:MAG: hypothetical protein IJQ65_03875 [Kiritimatiellae bacterium]|nr:hypothetical protein [Kiritimatiellia bacterium]
MKGWRSAFVSAVMVLLTIAAVVLVFPYGALTFRPRPDGPAQPAFAAFVALSPTEEAAAMKAAKSSWNAGAGAVRRMRAELFVSELPRGRDEPALEIADRAHSQTLPPLSPGLQPFMPSQAAPPPAKIEPDKADLKDESASAFSREELLRMN